MSLEPVTQRSIAELLVEPADSAPHFHALVFVHGSRCVLVGGLTHRQFVSELAHFVQDAMDPGLAEASALVPRTVGQRAIAAGGVR